MSGNLEVKTNHASGDNAPLATRPVFYDPRHIRRSLFLTFGSLFVLVAAVWLTGFALSLYLVEKLPEADAVLRDPGAPVTAQDPLFRAAPAPTPATSSDTAPVVAPLAPQCTAEYLQLPSTPVDGRRKVYAFLPYWPEWSFVSVNNSCSKIDVMLPQWYRVDDLATGIVPFDEETEHQVYIRDILSRNRATTAVMPVVTLETTLWAAHPPDAERPLHDLARALEALASASGYDGICVSAPELPDNRRAGLIEFLRDLDKRLDQTGRESCLIVQGGDGILRMPGLSGAADRFVWLGFETPWIGSEPAPLAPFDWFVREAKRAVDIFGKDKLVVAVGNQAFDWSSGSSVPEQIAFAEAMRRAVRADAEVTFSPEALNTHIRFADAKAVQHEIWVLDAVSAYNQLRALDKMGVTAALWPIGLEDPTVWKLMGTDLPDADEAARMLREVSLAEFVGYEGAGAFQRVLQPERPGTRELTADPVSGLLTGQSYASLPAPYTIERFGAADPDVVVLTFDDGPSREYTPRILDTLRDANVPAAFFLVGKNVMQFPDLARRIVDEGHEVGSHTFLHPQLEAVSTSRAALELNALQRVLVGATGRRTILFRMPYGRGEGPLTGEKAAPLALINGSGHIVVGSEIVPPDWRKPSADEIVEHVRAELDRNRGHVIVMHDAGGDRHATVEALPKLIDLLRADGYRFASLAELLGVDRDMLMPPETGPRATFDGYSFTFLSALFAAAALFFWIVVFAGAARSISMIVLSHIRGRRRREEADFAPGVTVLIPAFNEAPVIVNSIATVLASDYPSIKVIVVDDGSSDSTFDTVLDAFGNDPRVTLVSEPNQGKWKALDTAYEDVETEIVVAIDADTILLPDSIRRLVLPFRDSRVGAVAGNVKVGNRNNLLTRLQALEYITAQNIDRRAMELINGMMVVPGAIGAWRTEAVRKAGLYSGQTVTEDADLTVSILRAGYRARFAEHAVSVTEAPETVEAFLKQRLRWTFGMMQTAWKHRGAALQGRAVGLITIPDLLVFGVLIPLMAPLADIVFIAALSDFLIDAAIGRPLAQREDALFVIAGYLALPLLDVVTAMLAFRMQRDESPWLMLLLPLQRFFYRQLLYFTVYRSVFRILGGKMAGWGKLIRRGTVRMSME